MGILVGLVVLVAACGWLVRAALPAMLGTGLSAEDRQWPFTLGDLIEEAGFPDAKVAIGTTRSSAKGTYLEITVEASPRGDSVEDEAGAIEVARIVLDAYPRIDEIRYLSVTFSTETRGVGRIPIERSWTRSGTPAEWRARVAGT